MANYAPYPVLRFYDDNNNPLVGGKLYVYLAGTTTPTPTYQDVAGTTPNSNPVILDSRGEALVYLATNISYKFVLKTSADVTIRTTDNITAIAQPTVAGNAMLGAANAAAQRTLLGLSATAPSAVGNSMLIAATAATQRTNIGLSATAPSTAGNNILTAVDVPAQRVLLGVNTLTGRNRIINGAMEVWQRGTSVSPGTGSNGRYTADRFFVAHGGVSGITISQSGTIGKYYLKIQRNASNTSTASFDMRQVIESLNCADLAGKQATISFTAYVGANYAGGDVFIQYGSSAVTDDAVTGGGLSFTTAATITPTTTPTVYTATFTAPANMVTLALRITNSTYTGTAGADDSFYITNVQLEEGNVANAFEYRPFGQELLLCLRYYKSYNMPINPIGVLPTHFIAIGMVTSATTLRFTANLRVPMRVTPVLGVPGIYTLNAQTSTYGSVTFNSGTDTISTFSSPSDNTETCTFTITSSGAAYTPGHILLLYFKGDSSFATSLTFDAEL